MVWELEYILERHFLVDVQSRFIGFILPVTLSLAHRLEVSVAAFGDCSGPHKSLF